MTATNIRIIICNNDNDILNDMRIILYGNMDIYNRLSNVLNSVLYNKFQEYNTRYDLDIIDLMFGTISLYMDKDMNDEEGLEMFRFLVNTLNIAFG